MDSLFLLALFAIALGALVDFYYTIRTRLTWIDEQNPLAAWILKRWGLNVFLKVKAIGTLLVLGVLWIVYEWLPVPTLIIASALAAFMAWVAGYLWWYS